MSSAPYLPTAYFAGSYLPFDQATVSIATHGLQYGSGVFGGIRGYALRGGNCGIFRLSDHVARFCASARLIGIDLSLSSQELERVVVELVKRNNPDSDSYLRLFAYKAGLDLPPGLHGVADGLAVYMARLGRYHQQADKGLRLQVSSWRRIDDAMIPARGKIAGAYINSSLAKDEAVRRGFDDAIMLNQDGSVAEVSTCNLLMVRDGVLITPPVSDNILEGITRKSLLHMAHNLAIPLVERSIDRSELAIADEVMICGTAVELGWVREVDNWTIGSGRPGAIFTRLHDLFVKIVRDEQPDYASWITKVVQS